MSKRRKRRSKVRLHRVLILLFTAALILYCLIIAVGFVRNLFHRPARLPEEEKTEQSMIQSGYAQACPDEIASLTRFGIDVSQYQESIDWNSVKESGVEYAFIRVGARGYVSGEIYEDETFLENLYGAKEAGIPVGVYFFSQSVSNEEAVEEAEYVLSVLNGYSLELPVVFDFELPADEQARTHDLNSSEIASQAQVFLEHIQQGGYQPMLYLNSGLFSIYENAGLTEQWPIWYAEYGVSQPDRCGLDIWQYSETGTIPGISDHTVDLNLMRQDFLKIQS
ncbi:GH25 family lysozyme [Allobaculum sp. JKK-2023]|uniref:GH25 family lysozyme n=1 Tax=Allobaculum sp. JKK-2023 TaxID=3108943 RepID=UPI002B054CA2|nr:GH25 family lysozyme [Allobaculum sp. JKK-2023]